MFGGCAFSFDDDTARGETGVGKGLAAVGWWVPGVDGVAF